MNKHLRSFQNDAAYQSGVSSIIKPGIALVKDTMTLHYLTSFDFNPRYLFSDLSTGTELVSGKTVIGVEVIPARYTADQKARFVSVKNMSLTDPENGTVATGNNSDNPGAGIMWGAAQEIPGSTYKTQIGYLNGYDEKTGTYDGNIGDILHIKDDYSYLPVDCSYLFEEAIASGAMTEEQLEALKAASLGTGTLDQYWIPSIPMEGPVKSHQPYAPGPYSNTGAANSLYSDSRTACYDMSGKANTELIVGSLQDESWRTGTLNNSTDIYPAACACSRFCPGDTDPGDWYLPSAGELGYLAASLGRISKKIALAGTAGQSVVGIGDGLTYETLGGWLWSSSQKSSGDAWYLHTSVGNMGNYNKGNANDYSRVRAFFQL